MARGAELGEGQGDTRGEDLEKRCVCCHRRMEADLVQRQAFVSVHAVAVIGPRPLPARAALLRDTSRSRSRHPHVTHPFPPRASGPTSVYLAPCSAHPAPQPPPFLRF